jgi:hypothetical protein
MTGRMSNDDLYRLARYLMQDVRFRNAVLTVTNEFLGSELETVDLPSDAYDPNDFEDIGGIGVEPR